MRAWSVEPTGPGAQRNQSGSPRDPREAEAPPGPRRRRAQQPW